jgi:general secretion pathway protein H
MHRQRGLTLLELLVVMAIIGFAMAGVSLSLRDNSQTQLEREAQRLVAMLEAARTQSRTSGIAFIWQTTPQGFVIQPAQSQLATRTETWLTTGTQATVDTTATLNDTPRLANIVVLGPEPILAPTQLTLRVGIPMLRIGTDGLQPFHVLP